MNCISGNINYIDIMTLVLSAIAIVVSILVWLSQRKLSVLQNKPDCRIKVSSIENGCGFAIRLENVGTGIMVIDKILYYLDRGKSDRTSYKYISDYLCQDCDMSEQACKMRSEAVLDRNHLFPNSRHYLFKVRFANQKDLETAWEKISELKITVIYHSVYTSFVREIISHLFKTMKEEYLCEIEKKDETNLSSFRSLLFKYLGNEEYTQSFDVDFNTFNAAITCKRLPNDSQQQHRTIEAF